MKILHVIQRYSPAVGGAERLMAELSERLAATGHALTVATSDADAFELFWDPTQRRLPAGATTINGVSVRRFPVRHMPAPAVSYAAVRRLLWLSSRARLVPTAVSERLARLTPRVPALDQWLSTTDESFDLVAGMTITFEPLVAAAQRFARRRGLPFVCYPLTHLGAGPRPGQDSLSRFYTMRHQLALVRRSDAVVAQTATEKAFYVNRGFDETRVVVGGPGVDPRPAEAGDGARFQAMWGLDRPFVLALGSMSYDKGTVHTVEAVRRLWAGGRDVDLVLIGAVLAPFQAYLAQLPPQERERLHLLGPVGEAQKHDALAAADVLAMPSRADSFGIVYLEAWLHGTPVVGADAWGMGDVIADGDDGLLVPFGDVPALAAALARLLDDPAAAAAMGARGRTKTLREHTWARKCRVVHDLYERLGGGRQTAVAPGYLAPG